MLFTIDGANFIEKDDPKWEVVLAVMEKPTGQMLVSTSRCSRCFLGAAQAQNLWQAAMHFCMRCNALAAFAFCILPRHWWGLCGHEDFN